MLTPTPNPYKIVPLFAGVAGTAIAAQPIVLWVPGVGPVQMVENTIPDEDEDNA